MTPQPMSSQPQQGKKSSSTVLIIVLVVLGFGGLCCVGTMAAIAIPNFIKFQARSKQAEAKSNLKGLFVAQKALFAEKDTYADAFETIGFRPEPGNRYVYFLTEDGSVYTPGGPMDGEHSVWAADAKRHPEVVGLAEARSAIPAGLAAELGFHGTCPSDCDVTAVAVGNIDTDATLDVWSVSTKDRVVDGERVPAGVPHVHVDDTRE